MASLEISGLVAEQDRLRARARGQRRQSSVPLVGLASLVTGAAAIRLVGGDQVVDAPYWLVAGPLMLLVVRAWHGRNERRLGIGRGPGSYGWAAVVTTVLMVPAILLVPMAAVCAGLLLVALQQRNGYLARWSVVLGVLGSLANLGFWDNRLYELNNWLHDYQAAREGYFEHAGALSLGLLAVLSAYAAARAARRERV